MIVDQQSAKAKLLVDVNQFGEDKAGFVEYVLKHIDGRWYIYNIKQSDQAAWNRG